MPTYDYECDACGHTFEEWQSFHDEPLTKCPGCKKQKVRRLLGGGAAIIFKGSGFYQTDYRSESYKKAEKADADAASGGKSEAKADDKPAEPAKGNGAGPAGGAAKGKKAGK
jgi:putative FmdB family regulatory protein